MGPLRRPEVLLKIYQVTVRLPVLRMAEPDKNRKLLEFSENAAKAYLTSLMKRAVGSSSVSYSIVALAANSDYWPNQQGRLSSPMVRDAGATHYQPITCRGFCDDLGGLNCLDSPRSGQLLHLRQDDQSACFSSAVVGAPVWTSFPDRPNMCHESSEFRWSRRSASARADDAGRYGEDRSHLHLWKQPGRNHPRTLTTLQRAKDHGVKIIGVESPTRSEHDRVTIPNPQDYRSL